MAADTRDRPPVVGAVLHLSTVLLLAAVVLATYSNAFQAGFTSDSTALIRDADHVHAATAENVKLILTHSYWWPTMMSSVYRPLTTLSFLVNYAMLGNGNRPAGYHWVNLGLHWANAVLLYLLALRLSGTFLTAVFAATLFAVHPIATEAVTYLVGRADLFASAAVLAGLLLHIGCQAATRKWLWRLGFLLTATAGVFCKESAATLLGVVALYDVLFRLGSDDTVSARRLLTRLMRFAIEGWVILLPPFALMWGMRRWLIRDAAPIPPNFTDNVLVSTDYLTARLTAIKIVGQELWQLLWPARLCWDYSVAETRLFGWHLGRWADQQALIALLALLVIAVLTVALRRRAPAAVFFVGFFFITLLPTSNLIILIYSTRADRFLYLPSAGAAGCVALAAGGAAALVGRLCARHMHGQPLWATVAVYGLLSAGLVALAVRAHVRNRDWQSQLTLCTHDVQSCPNSFRTRRCLATELYYSDRRTNVDRAIVEAEAAQAILDHAAPATETAPGAVLEDLGLYYETKADLLPEAERRAWDAKVVSALERATTAQQSRSAAYRESERLRGRRPEDIPEIGSSQFYLTQLTLGQAYLQLSEPHKAVDALVRARRLAPANASIHSVLASAYVAVGDSENAILSLLQTFLSDNTRQDVWPRLFALYQQIDPGSCAFTLTAGQYQFNHDCPIVHRHICAALDRQAERFAAAGDLDAVENVRDAAVRLHGCRANE